LCFLKRLTNPELATALVEEHPQGYDAELWDADCGGEWGHCSVTPLLYESGGEAITPTASVGTPMVDPSIEEFDPFSTSEDDAEQPFEKPPEEDPRIPKKKSESEEEKASRIAREQAKYAERIQRPSARDFEVQVVIKRTDNPYFVTSDAIAVPTNLVMTVMDPEFMHLTGGTIQMACDQIKSRVKMGGAYKTEVKGKVAPKVCYHLVVAGHNQVGESDIKKAVRRALTRAEEDGVRVLTMLPMDCGLLDVGVAAMAQLQAVYEFLVSYEPQNLRRVGILMRDQASEVSFKRYYQRVFRHNLNAPAP
jgi:hypothetical protein